MKRCFDGTHRVQSNLWDSFIPFIKIQSFQCSLITGFDNIMHSLFRTLFGSLPFSLYNSHFSFFSLSLGNAQSKLELVKCIWMTGNFHQTNLYIFFFISLVKYFSNSKFQFIQRKWFFGTTTFWSNDFVDKKMGLSRNRCSHTLQIRG